MNTKHTPGPWKATESFAPDGSSRGLHIRAWRNHVAYMPGVGHQDFADAALIAAAPELLEALQRIVRAGDRLSINHPLDGLVDEARAAIAKATGA